MTEIPIVDLSNLDLNRDRVTNELDKAFSTVGFVYLKNHGVEQHLVDKVLEASRSFFQLPDDVKQANQFDIKRLSGYTRNKDKENLNSLKVNKRYGVRETYDVTSPNDIYPDDKAPELRQAICDLSASLCTLTFNLLKCLSIALGKDEDFLGSRHKFIFDGTEKNRTTFRSLYYPPLTENDIQPGVIRCGEHTDYGTITLLLQDDMGGLEVLSVGKEWIPAVPIPGTILVNLGDLTQFWTANRYVATVHRVRVPEEEIRRRTARQSIAYFVQPDIGVMVAPLDGSDKHPPVEALAFLKNRLSEAYNRL